ncbi:MAG: NUDIX hydrolase [Bacteroidetes bacterium]|nr:NUDIX hydrolase [Bacteroidota bacterium]
MPYTYDYQRPALTVDAIILRKESGQLSILLIQRDKPPFEGMWALPGGFMDINETLEEAIERELWEETGLTGIHLHQFHTFSALGRDPRGRTISVAYYGFADAVTIPKAGDDARDAQWYSINYLPLMAFDHNQIVNMALHRLVFNGKIQDPTF